MILHCRIFLIAYVCHIHSCHRTERRNAQMRTVADVWTVVFVPEINTEWHRHPSRMPKLQAMTKFSKRSEPEELNCYSTCPVLFVDVK